RARGGALGPRQTPRARGVSRPGARRDRRPVAPPARRALGARAPCRSDAALGVGAGRADPARARDAPARRRGGPRDRRHSAGRGVRAGVGARASGLHRRGAALALRNAGARVRAQRGALLRALARRAQRRRSGARARRGARLRPRRAGGRGARMKRPLRIAVIPGDGIGPEVVREGVRLLEWYRERRGLPLELWPLDLGAERWLGEGVGLPDALRAEIGASAAAVLLGALGDPRIPGHEHARAILFGLRTGFDLYAQIRPA